MSTQIKAKYKKLYAEAVKPHGNRHRKIFPYTMIITNNNHLVKEHAIYCIYFHTLDINTLKIIRGF